MLAEKYPNVSARPPANEFIPFTAEEFDAFLGILLVRGVHKSNTENIEELWSSDAIPLVRAAMSKTRFQHLLKCIRFDNQATRAERTKTDKAAAIRDVWTMMDQNLQKKNYKPSASVAIDEQLFPYIRRTMFLQYIDSKPAKYGIKIFWCCCCQTAYPLRSQIYLSKQPGEERQKNVGGRVVLDLVGQ